MEVTTLLFLGYAGVFTLLLLGIYWFFMSIKNKKSKNVPLETLYDLEKIERRTEQNDGTDPYKILRSIHRPESSITLISGTTGSIADEVGGISTEGTIGQPEERHSISLPSIEQPTSHEQQVGSLDTSNDGIESDNQSPSESRASEDTTTSTANEDGTAISSDANNATSRFKRIFGGK